MMLLENKMLGKVYRTMQNEVTDREIYIKQSSIV
jgi:hypothetical protein